MGMNGKPFRASITAYATLAGLVATISAGAVVYGQMTEKVERNEGDVAQHEREIDAIQRDISGIKQEVEATRREQKVLNEVAASQRQRIERKLNRLLETFSIPNIPNRGGRR